VSMTKRAQEQTADMLEHYANDVREGRVNWVWCAFKFEEGRITFGTKDAPRRPHGLS
jgi:hypothetical protein